jgi:hypothetical protein
MDGVVDYCGSFYMRLWSSKKLEKELAEGRLAEWDKAKYIIWPTVITFLLGGPIFLFTPHYGSRPESHTVSLLIGNIVMAVVSFCGIRMGYRENQRIDGRFFIERYSILSFPVWIRFCICFILGLVVLFIVFAALTHSSPELRRFTLPVMRTVFPAIVFWMYWLVARSVRRFGNHLKSQGNTGHLA